MSRIRVALNRSSSDSNCSAMANASQHLISIVNICKNGHVYTLRDVYIEAAQAEACSCVDCTVLVDPHIDQEFSTAAPLQF